MRVPRFIFEVHKLVLLPFSAWFVGFVSRSEEPGHGRALELVDLAGLAELAE